MKTLLLALVSIMMSVAAQFSLKAGMSSIKAGQTSTGWMAVGTNKFVLLGFLLYGLGAVVWLSVLSRWEVSKAYPLVGLGFVLSFIVGAALGEQVSAQRFAGVAFVCAGVVLIARS